MMRRVIAIVGATATGKTALGIALAQQVGGEILNADSRQVYAGMDIGTAKPTSAERAEAPHHLLDLVTPDETITLTRWVDAVKVALEAVWSRGRQPIVVGGAGQYVWALLEGWRVPRVAPDRELRARLEQEEGMHAGSLLQALKEVDPLSAGRIDPNNLRRLIRAIEVTRATGRPFSEWQAKEQPEFEAVVVGLRLDRRALHERIDARADAMFAGGLIEEVRGLNARGYGCELPAMSGIGYRQACQYLAGEISQADAIARTKTETHRLARMQHAWFKPGDARIKWLDAASATLIQDALATVDLPSSR
jgi:tRNA dimethylallyltransferase